MSKVTKEVTETITTIHCDFCGKEGMGFSRRVKPCPICKRDVCGECAIVTDHWYLSPGEFMGDYPDHYCKECWAKGKETIEAILACREKENELWEEWHSTT